MMFFKTSQSSWKSICDGVSFAKILSSHVCICTEKDAITGVFLWITFVNIIFFVSLHSSIRWDIFYTKSVFLKISLSRNNCAGFFLLDKVAHHQACKFIKKRLQMFYCEFCEIVKSPLKNSSDFSATLLTLRPQKTYIYIFPALFVFGYF